MLVDLLLLVDHRDGDGGRTIDRKRRESISLTGDGEAAEHERQRARFDETMSHVENLLAES